MPQLSTIGFEAAIPVWHGEDPWLFVQRHRPEVMTHNHWHSHIEINYLPHNAMCYLSSGRSIEIAARQIVLFWATIPHQVTATEDQGDIICIYLPLQEFMRWPLPIRLSHAVMHGSFLLGVTEDAADPTVFDRWWQDSQSNDWHVRRLAVDEIQLRIRRLALTGWKLDHLQPPTAQSGIKSSRNIAHVEIMTHYIAQHYIEPISIETLAHQVGLHPNYAMTVFKQVVGMSISAYITRHRLSHAQTMLIHTDKPILSIVMECGFGSLSRFYEVFRKHLGLTPRQYRQRWRKR